MKTALLLASVLALTLGAGCTTDCESRCERDYRDCLEDPGMSSVQCDVGLDQCYVSCGTMGSPVTTAAPDGG